MANGDTKTNQYLDIAANGSRADLPADSCCDTRTQSLIRGVAERIMDVEDEVEELKNNPDVVDIVATYADLGDYDTSGLTDKDVIRVLQDETHNDDSTYYRWDATAQEWSYIGESKQYTDFVGTDGTAAGEAGLVPAPAITDAGKFLKADGTWDTAGSTINVVQTTGTSTTDVMSQNAVTDMIAPRNSNDALWINNPKGTNTIPATLSDYSVTINPTTSGTGGGGATATSAIAINGTASGHSAISIGVNSSASQRGSIAIGRGASATSVGEMNIGTNDTTAGYNSTNYRLLSGVHDPVNDHDAATKGYVDANTGYNFNSQVVQSAYEDPEVTKSLSEAEYQALEDVCVNLGKLYYGYSGAGYHSRDDSIYYECTDGTSINIYSNSPSINGSFSFAYNGGVPTVVFVPN